ncbi:hypothetical protein Nmel_015552 [Mimus melanotis]
MSSLSLNTSRIVTPPSPWAAITLPLKKFLLNVQPKPPSAQTSSTGIRTGSFPYTAQIYVTIPKHAPCAPDTSPYPAGRLGNGRGAGHPGPQDNAAVKPCRVPRRSQPMGVRGPTALANGRPGGGAGGQWGAAGAQGAGQRRCEARTDQSAAPSALQRAGPAALERWATGRGRPQRDSAIPVPAPRVSRRLPRAWPLPRPLPPVFPHSRQLSAARCSQTGLRALGRACRAFLTSLGGGKSRRAGRWSGRALWRSCRAGAGLGRAGRAAVLVWLLAGERALNASRRWSRRCSGCARGRARPRRGHRAAPESALGMAIPVGLLGSRCFWQVLLQL